MHGRSQARRWTGPVIDLLMLVVLLVGALAARSARAEPAAMKERQQHPRLEVVSKDGRYSVAVGGFLQARYTADVSAAPSLTSRFEVPRTRLYVFGRLFAPEVRYRLMLGTAPNRLEVQLHDAYVEWWARPWARLRGGYFKVPVLREWVESARLLGSVERSLATRLVIPGRRAGVMVSGGLGGERVEYWLGAFAAAEAAGSDLGPAPVLAGRAVWNTSGRSIEGEVDLRRSPRAVSIGGSGYAAWAPGVRQWLAAGELAGRHRGFDGAVEVAYRRRDEGPRRDRFVVGYARANYFIRPARSAVGVRVAEIVGLDDPSRTRTDLDLDFSALLDGHDLKLQISGGPAYLPAHRRWEGAVQLQVQAAF